MTAYPAEGSGGMFFNGVRGATPKYAKNLGDVKNDFVDSMARFFILPTKTKSEDKYTALSQKFGPVFSDVVKRIYGNGYIDFILQNVQTGLNEKVEVTEDLGGGYVAYYFGTSPQVLQCSGSLINSMQDDQVVSMVRLYAEILRGTKLAENHETLRFRYDSFLYTGYINNISWSLQAENELVCPFNFTFLVKKRVDIPSTIFKPVSLSALPAELGEMDVLARGRVPQRVTTTAPPVKQVAAAKPGPPPDDETGAVQSVINTLASKSATSSDDQAAEEAQIRFRAEVPAGG